ncbi:MAG: DUF4376 domain-containing protein [Desulfobacterales bacterium]|nr:DUF4376 domain-containing protein [Desulfobacterales bacterium]
MRLTIVKADNVVIMNGQALRIDLSSLSLPEDFRALQWFGTSGVIEDTACRNIKIENLDSFQAVIDAYNAEKERLANAMAQEEAKKINEYYSIAGIKKRLAAKRWQVETQGIKWNGHVVDTSRESQAKISNVYLTRDRFASLTWKFKDGFSTITADDISQIYAIMINHVQTCFAIEQQKIEMIDSLSEEELRANADEIINSRWGNN